MTDHQKFKKVDHDSVNILSNGYSKFKINPSQSKPITFYISIQGLTNPTRVHYTTTIQSADDSKSRRNIES